jgi:tRNA G46 methylase TrmB
MNHLGFNISQEENSLQIRYQDDDDNIIEIFSETNYDTTTTNAKFVDIGFGDGTASKSSSLAISTMSSSP